MHYKQRSSLLVVATLIAIAATSLQASAESKQSTRFVVTLQSSSKFAVKRIGHGLCLDRPCIHVLTNYHVAAFIGKATVEGVRIKGVQYATDATDPAAVSMLVLGKTQRYNPDRDLAVVTLERPLPHQFVAAEFADYVPQVGQPVHRLPAFPGRSEGWLRNVGSIRLLTADGKTVRNMQRALMTDFDSVTGNSGGALCDAHNRVLGIVTLQSGTLALPVDAISEFLLRVDPRFLAALNLRRVPLASTAVESDEIATLKTPLIIVGASLNPDAAVNALRENANLVRNEIKHLVMEQKIRSWGPGAGASVWMYELGLFGTGVSFRRLGPRNERSEEQTETDLPQAGVVPGAEWNHLLAALERGDVVYVGDAMFAEAPAHVFHTQNLLCPYREQLADKFRSDDVPCSAEIITDLRMLPTQIRLTYDFAADWQTTQLVTEISFRHLPVEGRLILLPTETNTRARFRGFQGEYRATAVLQKCRLFAATHAVHSD